MKDKLTIEHLACYLPYGLKAINYFGNITIIKGLQRGDESVNNDLWKFKHTDGSFLTGYLYECKPILRPLSDLTKEITHNGETFVPIMKLVKIVLPNSLSDEWYDSPNIQLGVERGNYFSEEFFFDENGFQYLIQGVPSQVKNQYELFQKLISWHFDVFGLLDKDLAVNINTLTNKEE